MVDPELLEIVGPRFAYVGILGSVLPAICASLAAYVWGAAAKEAFVVGAALCTVSQGIVLHVMRTGGILDQPIGQLIIAASTCNELVAIVAYAIVGNLVEGRDSWTSYAYPVAVNFVGVALVGYVAVRMVPDAVERRILTTVRPEQHEGVLLGMVLALALGLMPACKHSGASEITACFLAGLCFCTNAHALAGWHRQLKRVQTWLMHLFFAATIGFECTLLGHWPSATVLRKTALLLPCAAPKLAMGVFAVPYSATNSRVLAFAWGGWGEFSLLIATLAKGGHGGRVLIETSTYDAIVLATLVSIVVCPAALLWTSRQLEAIADADIVSAICATGHLKSLQHAYYCVETRAPAHWDARARLLRTLRVCKCEIVDIREWCLPPRLLFFSRLREQLCVTASFFLGTRATTSETRTPCTRSTSRTASRSYPSTI